MKRNFKYVKTTKTRVNHKGETVPVYKKISSNLTTWAPYRSYAYIARVKHDRAINRLKDMGLLNYFRPGLNPKTT